MKFSNDIFIFFFGKFNGGVCGGIKFSHPQFYMSLQLILFLQILLVSHVAAPFDYLCNNVYKDVNYLYGYGKGQMDDFKIVIKRIFSS